MPESSGLVLAVDTSTDVCVGVARDGAVLARARLADNRAHVEQLAPLTTAVLAEAGEVLTDLDRIVVGLGPGPFTGLRVGVATAQMFAAALQLDLHQVCSLDVIAADWARSDTAPAGDFLIATDARRKELYWARYDRTGARVDGPHVSKPADLPDLPVTGPGVDVHPLPGAVPGPRSLDAGVMAALGGDLPSAGATPLYLRRPDAAEPSKPKTTLAHRPRVRRRRSPLVEPAETTSADPAPLVEPVETTPATLDDLPALVALEESGFPARERWSAESWRDELTGDGRTVLVARRAGAGIVGAVTVQTVGPTADLHRVVVDPSARRTGVGRRLTAAAVAAAEGAGARKVVLEVRYDNEPAIALYQSLGFEQLGVRKDYYGTGLDALILKLYDLDPDNPGSAVEGAR